MNKLAILASILSFTACSIGDTDETSNPNCLGSKCDGWNPGLYCEDPGYGDGVCQTQLQCAAPDVDCFTAFDTDLAAAHWYHDNIETKYSREHSQPMRPILAPEDPRYQKARALVDRGWAAFREARPVGALANISPAVVVVEDPEVNAFVAPDERTNTVGFVVVVQTGLLERGGDDAAMLGVMMHELQHAVGLHVIKGVGDRLRKFYVAGSVEPIGRQAPAHPIASKYGPMWRGPASEGGPYSNFELGGFPLGGDLDQIFQSVLARAAQANGAACQHAFDLYGQLRQDAVAMMDPLLGSVYVDSSFYLRVPGVLGVVRDECAFNITQSFQEIGAEVAGITPAQLDAMLQPGDHEAIAGKHVVDQIAALVWNRRTAMRAAEQGFEAETNLSWQSVRFFSTEEDADDVSVRVLAAAGLEPTGIAKFLLTIAPPECGPLLATGAVPPYGIDLADEHHSACFRVYHVGAVAQPNGLASRSETIALPPAPPHFLSNRLSDRLAY